MKKIILSTLIAAAFSPMLAMAETDQPPVQPMEQMEAMSDEAPMVMHHGNGARHGEKMGMHKEMRLEQGEKMQKGAMGKKGMHPNKRPDLTQMTLEEKEEFFNKRIESMERHNKQMGQEIEELKKMTTEEKETFFKEKHSKMKNHKKSFRSVCEEMKKNEHKEFSIEEAETKMKMSKKYQRADEEQKAKMEARFNELKSLSPEERQQAIEKRRAKLRTMCDMQK